MGADDAEAPGAFEGDDDAWNELGAGEGVIAIEAAGEFDADAVPGVVVTDGAPQAARISAAAVAAPRTSSLLAVALNSTIAWMTPRH